MTDEVDVKAMDAVVRLDAAELIKPFAGPDLPLIEETGRIIADVFRPLLAEKEAENARITERKQALLYAHDAWKARAIAAEEDRDTAIRERMDEAHEHALTIESKSEVILDLVDMKAERDAALRVTDGLIAEVRRLREEVNDATWAIVKALGAHPQVVTLMGVVKMICDDLNAAQAEARNEENFKQLAYMREDATKALLAVAEAERDQLRTALQEAANKFRQYATMHANKLTLAGRVKSETNLEMAERMERALAPPSAPAETHATQESPLGHNCGKQPGLCESTCGPAHELYRDRRPSLDGHPTEEEPPAAPKLPAWAYACGVHRAGSLHGAGLSCPYEHAPTPDPVPSTTSEENRE